MSSTHHPETDDADQLDIDTRPSKSLKKRESHALQDLVPRENPPRAGMARWMCGRCGWRRTGQLAVDNAARCPIVSHRVV